MSQLEQPLDLAFFERNASLGVINCVSNYVFFRTEEGYEYSANFYVKEDPELHIPDLTASGITSAQYRYLHACSIAMTLSALEDRPFPGAKKHGSAYSFEYAVKHSLEDFNTFIVEQLLLYWPNTQISLLEVGGQEGKWSDKIQISAREKGFTIDPTIIDLDLYRRFRHRFPHNVSTTENATSYIQADAHNLQKVWDAYRSGPPHAITLLNVADVIFDPFSIFQQAWEMLPINGILFIGDSVYKIDLPFSISEDEEGLANDSARETSVADIPIPNAPFSYDSRKQEDEEIANITTALYKHKRNRSSKLGEVLLRMGCQVAYRSSSDEGRMLAIIKTDMQNPFEKFIVDGISVSDFHVGEYPFPQIHRSVKYL